VVALVNGSTGDAEQIGTVKATAQSQNCDLSLTAIINAFVFR
jgi:hypothetical protein